MRSLVFLRRKFGLQPTFPTAIHRFDIGVTHFLQAIRRECGAKAASTIEDESCGCVGDTFLNVALDNATAHVNGARQMTLGPFAIFANVNQQEFFASVHATLYVGDVGFFYVLLGIIDERKKTGCVSHGNASSGLDLSKVSHADGASETGHGHIAGCKYHSIAIILPQQPLEPYRTSAPR